MLLCLCKSQKKVWTSGNGRNVWLEMYHSMADFKVDSCDVKTTVLSYIFSAKGMHQVVVFDAFAPL